MSDINSVMITGRLGQDPDTRYTPSGMAVSKMSVAVSGFKKGSNEKPTHWIPCVAFDKTAEFISTSARSGARVAIHGRLDFQKWTDRQSGGNRTAIRVIVESFNLYDWPDTGQVNKPANASRQPDPPADDGFDDIPF